MGVRSRVGDAASEADERRDRGEHDEAVQAVLNASSGGQGSSTKTGKLEVMLHMRYPQRQRDTRAVGYQTWKSNDIQPWENLAVCEMMHHPPPHTAPQRCILDNRTPLWAPHPPMTGRPVPNPPPGHRPLHGKTAPPPRPGGTRRRLKAMAPKTSTKCHEQPAQPSPRHAVAAWSRSRAPLRGRPATMLHVGPTRLLRATAQGPEPPMCSPQRLEV